MLCPQCRRTPSVFGELFGCQKCGHFVSVEKFWNEYVERLVCVAPEFLRARRESKTEKLIFDAMMGIDPKENA